MLVGSSAAAILRHSLLQYAPSTDFLAIGRLGAAGNAATTPLCNAAIVTYNLKVCNVTNRAAQCALIAWTFLLVELLKEGLPNMNLYLKPDRLAVKT